MAFKITSREFYLSLVFAGAGFFLSSAQYISYRSGLNPLVGLGFSYLMLLVGLFVLSKVGLINWTLSTGNFKQLIGGALILFSFFIITDWVSISQLASPEIIPTQSEGGIVYYIWQSYFEIEEISQLRFLTFVLTPLLLSLAGAYLVSEKISV